MIEQGSSVFGRPQPEIRKFPAQSALRGGAESIKTRRLTAARGLRSKNDDTDLFNVYIVADNGEKAGIMSSCNEARALLQVCYRWGEIVDLIFWVW